MIDYFNRQGEAITYEQYVELTKDWNSGNGISKRVAYTVTPDGGYVSTVWLGMNHGWLNEPILIFESMKFPELDCDRYSTEIAAIDGHAAMVARYGGGR